MQTEYFWISEAVMVLLLDLREEPLDPEVLQKGRRQLSTAQVDARAFITC
ncbi:hypothetical protein JFU47_00825 [Pseudomonas sp. TH39(2020)]|nr:hypothetical protein [Pseudomonas sp. TH39(2020)]MBK5395293.1 hypothetical protein [Pseudomonas sp. TH39(2020)]